MSKTPSPTRRKSQSPKSGRKVTTPNKSTPASAKRKSPKKEARRYFLLDFFKNPDAKFSLESVTTAVCSIWERRYEKDDDGKIPDRCSRAQKEKCFKEASDLLGEIRRRSIEMAASSLLKIAQDNGVRRSDGQKVGTWKECKNVFINNAFTEKDALTFDTVYNCVGTGWETDKERELMKKMNIVYRPWKSPKKTPKGFFSKMLTLGINAKRKEIFWLKRVTPLEENEEGQKTVRRNKFLVKFDPAVHRVLPKGKR